MIFNNAQLRLQQGGLQAARHHGSSVVVILAVGSGHTYNFVLVRILPE